MTEEPHLSISTCLSQERSDPIALSAQQLRGTLESTRRALRIMVSAVAARRDLAFAVPKRVAAFASADARDLASRGDCLGTAVAASAADSESRQANLVMRILIALEELAVANEALTDLATAVGGQLVGEPGKLVSRREIASMLGVTEEVVRQRHQAGMLLAVISTGRKHGRGFPIFQTWDGIAGAPLEQILEAIGYEGPGASNGADAAEAFQFFASRNEMAGGFTPVEVLTGVALPFPDEVEMADFLMKPHEERLDFLVSVARAAAKSWEN